MNSGRGPDPIDRSFEEKIKRPSYVYPVSFPVFWREVKTKLGERETRRTGLPVYFNRVAYAAASLAVLLVILLTVQPYFRTSVTVTLLRGSAETRSAADGKWHRARLGERLTDGTQLRTGDGSEFEVRIGKDTLVRLRENAVLTLKNASRDYGNLPVMVKLEQGSAAFSPKPENPKKMFQVLTALVNVTSDRRVFTVAVAPEGNVNIAAVEGPVLLEPVLQVQGYGVKESAALQDLQQAVLKNNLKPAELQEGSSAEISKPAVERIYLALSNAAERIAQGEPAEPVVKYFNESVFLSSPVVSLGKADAEDIRYASVLRENAGTPGPKVSAEFVSEPRDALVTVNGRPVGPTPFYALMGKNVPLAVSVYKKGFAAMSTNITLTNDSVVKVSLPRSSDQAGFEITEGGAYPDYLEWFENLPAGVLDKPVSFEESTVYSSDGNTLKIYENKSLVRTVAPGKANDAFGRPLYFNGRVYVASENGGLYIYTPAGEDLKSVSGAGKLRANQHPVLAGNRIVLPSYEKGIEVYSDEGDLVRRISPETYGTPAGTPYYNLKKDILVFRTADRRIIALGANMEKMVWSRDSVSADVMAGNQESVFLSSRADGTLSAVSLSAGKPAWPVKSPEFAKSDLSIAADKARVYVTAFSGHSTWFFAVSAATGETEYRQEFPGQRLQPQIIEGRVVLISRKSKTALYSPGARKMEYISILK